MMEWGQINGSNRDTILKCIQDLINTYKFINFIEVGCRDMKSGYAIKKYIEDNNCFCAYYGIDILDYSKMNRDNSIFIKADANDDAVLKSLPNEFHFVLIDSCHCKECVKKQGKMYSSRIVRGGYICFHDTARRVQHYSGEFHESHLGRGKLPVAVVDALNEIGLDKDGFKVIYQDDNHEGITCYKKWNI